MNSDTAEANPTDQGPPDRRARFPRWAVWLAILGATLVAVFVLRIVVGIGAAYVYFNSTPDFASFVAERATSPEHIDARLPAGKPLAQGATWTLGDVDSENARTFGAAVDVRITHGDEVLLETTVDFEALTDPETWMVRGFVIPVPEIRTRDGLRAVVQVGLLGVQKSLGDACQGRVFVDAVVVSGEGENLFRVVALDSPPKSWESTEVMPSWLRMLVGLVHPAEAPPEEGLLHQVQARFSPSWRKVDGGAQGAGVSPSRMRTNGPMYTHESEVTVRTRNGGSTSSTSNSWKRTYSWNGKVW